MTAPFLCTHSSSEQTLSSSCACPSSPEVVSRRAVELSSCANSDCRMKVDLPLFGGPKTVSKRSGAGREERMAEASEVMEKPFCSENVMNGMGRACASCALSSERTGLFGDGLESSKPDQLSMWSVGERGGLGGT
eukprot:CAMPEP_0181291526 /NCGR_PEP_ID=MMETSP1101-20121128/2015_1 /TAXON_ID=46948 /ORGANISM="Rhodomonas abbreviata, Strain Caron Lab Isolate" /LENGTH=134 /DNA_ID=CAMNT_0023395925 /DNA_START=437 /DNA_END=841 /DNA_ORIENTATION=+